MDYARALQEARERFGEDALVIRGDKVSPLSELAEQAESGPGTEVTLDTEGELEGISGKRIPAWTITETDPQAQPPAAGDRPPVLVVARRSLLGDSRINIEP